jgi:hypothetical protein
MKQILAAMVAPEKMGVAGSRWATIEGDTFVITNLQIHISRVADLKLQGYEIQYIDTEIAVNLIRNSLS